MSEVPILLIVVFGYWLIEKAIAAYENVQLAKYSEGCNCEEDEEESDASTSAS